MPAARDSLLSRLRRRYHSFAGTITSRHGSGQREAGMASIDNFNDHCWRDVIPEADLELYSGWRRETFVGARPALLAIDLYELVYRGGPHSPNELNARYPNSCGIYAHRAIAPTKRLLAAARRVDAPAGLRSVRRLRHLSRISPRAVRRRHLQAARQHLSGHAAVLASVAARRAKPDRVRREHVGLRARQRGRRLFQRLSRLPGRGMHLRSRRADAQGQLVRPASQIRRRHACRRGRDASRRHAPSACRGMRRAAATDATPRAGLNRACATVAAWARYAFPILLVLLAAPAWAQTEPVSFAGKQIKLMIGYSPTGYGYDTYGRLIARHLGKYLPGNPAIIPQNRPGAGSLNLANYLYYAAAKDGTEIAMVGRGVAMEPLIGAAQTKFDSRNFVWLGSMNNEVSGLFIRQGAPAANLPEVLAGARLTVGSTGAGGDQHVFTVALNSLLGTKLKPIAGYPGTQEIMLAIERGELDGIVGYSWGVARVGNRDDLASGRLKVVMQLGLEKHKELPDVPMLDDFVTAPMDRQVLDLIFSRQAMGRPLLAPPGLHPQVGEALRTAFTAAMRDPQLIAEAAKMDLELGFLGGADVQALVGRLYGSAPEVIARAQAIVAAN